MNKYIAAYDFGTSGVKLALVNQSGEIAVIKEKGYSLLRPAPAYVEQDPNEYWEAVCSVTREALVTAGAAPEDVSGLSFSVQARNIIPVDKDGNILYNAISWLDSRAGKQAEEINEKFGAPVLRSQDFQSRLLWLKQNEKEIYDKAECILDCNSFLQYKSTGVMRVENDNPNLVKYHPAIQEYIAKVNEAAGIERGKVPPVIEACKIFGVLDAKGARDLGLKEGIPVFGGSIDVCGAAAGAACINEGDAHMYFGSSGWLSAVISEPIETADGIYTLPSIIPDRLIYGGCINSCCMTLNWGIDMFYSSEKAKMGNKVYDLANEEAKAVPAGSENLLTGPWLDGEQCPINDLYARGVFFNMNQKHTRGHFINSIYESICYSMKWQAEYYTNDTGKTLQRMGANGGGSLSRHWIQILSDVLQMPVYVPVHSRHSGAIGAALAAAIGLGWTTEKDLPSFIKIEREFFPRKENASIYEEKYQLFKKLYRASKDLFTEMNAGKAV